MLTDLRDARARAAPKQTPTHVDERVHGADLVEVHRSRRDPVNDRLGQRRAGRTPPARASRTGAGSAAAPSERPDVRLAPPGGCTDRRRHPHPHPARRSGRRRVRRPDVDAAAEHGAATCRRSTAPSPGSAPSSMSPLNPATQSTQTAGEVTRATTRRATRAGEHRPAPKPLSMLTTATPGAQLFSIAEQRRQAAEARAVADARRHGDDRHARPARRRRSAGRPPSRRRRPAVGGVEPAACCAAAGAARPPRRRRYPLDPGPTGPGRDRRLLRHRQRPRCPRRPRRSARASVAARPPCRARQRRPRPRLGAAARTRCRLSPH